MIALKEAAVAPRGAARRSRAARAAARRDAFLALLQFGDAIVNGTRRRYCDGDGRQFDSSDASRGDVAKSGMNVMGCASVRLLRRFRLQFEREILGV